MAKMMAKSSLKKYAKLNGYTAEAFSMASFKKHLCMRFEISEFEMNKAMAKNKILIFVDFVSKGA